MLGANMRIKWIMRRDSYANIIRVCRIMWENDSYSAKLTVALKPTLFRWAVNRSPGIKQPNSWREWFVTILGVRIHYARSYGGRYA